MTSLKTGSIAKMANPQHLSKFKQGVEIWNKWRDECPNIRPDLSGAHLSEMELRGAVLWGANLERVDFVAANLEMANLGETNLKKAFLADANLEWAILCRANLRRTALWGANLKKADFRGASLKRAENLSVPQLSRVKTLYRAQLDSELMESIDKDYAHLLMEPDGQP
jgi:uncharacterized protein YjbI with pentapeptide repeats